MSVAVCNRPSAPFSETTKQWSTWVSLPPGTHHIRFLVDGVSTTADDLPTAVDDNGSLANYVAVPISGQTPPSATLHPTREQLPPPPTTGNGASFFADTEATAGGEDAAWTDKVPWQLECAAEEEEQWLSHSHTHSHGAQGQPPPPQHPQAPSLPRHLEKLILNQRPPTARASSKTSASSAALFGASGALPVTTASGTNLSATPSGRGRASGAGGEAAPTTREPYTKLGDAPPGVLAGTGNADDGSVLPVPSHVILHHLGTSAIRNGVLAVADTVRYKKKVRLVLDSYTIIHVTDYALWDAVYHDNLLQANMTPLTQSSFHLHLRRLFIHFFHETRCYGLSSPFPDNFFDGP